MSGVKISIAVICLFRPTSPELALSDMQRRRRSFFATQLADFPIFSSSLGGYCFFFVKKLARSEEIFKINYGGVFCVASGFCKH